MRFKDIALGYGKLKKKKLEWDEEDDCPNNIFSGVRVFFLLISLTSTINETWHAAWNFCWSTMA